MNQLVRARSIARAALACLATGCGAMPSPLTPGHHGSVGLPYFGVLTDAHELPPEGAGYVWHRQQGSHYGTSALVDMITEAAAQASPTPTSPPLVVGDLSGPRGGALRGHRSHRAGRDADLLFFYTTPGGAPVPAPGFVRVGADGLARVPRPGADMPPWVRLDVARCWSLVRALLTSPRADVLWLFVSRPVEALLIEYARAAGEEPELVWRAENVMQQPQGSLPHDDHFHLRIACSAEEMVAGCMDTGPAWPWLAPAPDLSLADDTLTALLREADEPDDLVKTAVVNPETHAWLFASPSVTLPLWPDATFRFAPRSIWAVGSERQRRQTSIAGLQGVYGDRQPHDGRGNSSTDGAVQ